MYRFFHAYLLNPADWMSRHEEHLFTVARSGLTSVITECLRFLRVFCANRLRTCLITWLSSMSVLRESLCKVVLWEFRWPQKNLPLKKS